MEEVKNTVEKEFDNISGVAKQEVTWTFYFQIWSLHFPYKLKCTVPISSMLCVCVSVFSGCRLAASRLLVWWCCARLWPCGVRSSFTQPGKAPPSTASTCRLSETWRSDCRRQTHTSDHYEAWIYTVLVTIYCLIWYKQVLKQIYQNPHCQVS